MTDSLKKLSGPALLGLFMTVAPLLFSSVVTYYAVTHEATVATFSATDWLALTLLCCLTSTLALTPPTLLALIFGYFLGWAALLPLLALNMGAIALVNALVRRLDHDRVLRLIAQNPKAMRILNRIKAEELTFIFFTKLSPVLPFAVTNLVFALSGASLRNILLGGFLGMVPRTALAVWTGAQAREIRTLLDNPNDGNWTQIALIGLLLASVVGLFSVLNRALRPAE